MHNQKQILHLCRLCELWRTAPGTPVCCCSSLLRRSLRATWRCREPLCPAVSLCPPHREVLLWQALQQLQDLGLVQVRHLHTAEAHPTAAYNSKQQVCSVCNLI